MHIFDLPQIYQKPCADQLRQALGLLTLTQSGFESRGSMVISEGVPKYLTTLISSSLAWIPSEDDREEIWKIASQCLAQRSGRTGMGDVTRTFTVQTKTGSMDILLHEPALTEDNLGLKTWGSSLTLANQLHSMCFNSLHMTNQLRILELGSGTGLVGLAAAAIWGKAVILTDLHEICPNLARNITANNSTLALHGGSALSTELNWMQPTQINLHGEEILQHSFDIVLAADTVYSPEHPKLVVDTLVVWLKKDPGARFILAYPVREVFAPQIREVRNLLATMGLDVERNTEHVGRDDWDKDVTHVCSVWKWSATALTS